MRPWSGAAVAPDADPGHRHRLQPVPGRLTPPARLSTPPAVATPTASACARASGVSDRSWRGSVARWAGISATAAAAGGECRWGVRRRGERGTRPTSWGRGRPPGPVEVVTDWDLLKEEAR